MGRYVGWVEWINANHYLTRTIGRIFNDSAAWLDGMKPNISAEPVIFKLGFTGFPRDFTRHLTPAEWDV